MKATKAGRWAENSTGPSGPPTGYTTHADDSLRVSFAYKPRENLTVNTMQKPDLFQITPEDRAKAVSALMAIIENGSDENKIEAASVLVEMDALNLQAREGSWLGKLCTN
jgi:hypothetical protein